MKIIIAITLITFLIGCSSPGSHMKYNNRVNNYLSASQQIPGTHLTENIRQKFELVFKDFKTGTTADNIKNLYAEEFYFNDTFKTINDIDTLIHYMQEAANNVESTEVEILDVVKGEKDYYLRWSMTMKFSAKGTKVDSVSIGMTQLRFNAEGKVILHQDYWDGAEGFYQHLPFIGFMVRKVRDSL